jgi:septum site-determining protein MinD
MRNIIGIASGKGGVGKTTITVNLAAALVQLGERVVIVDGNITTSNIGVQLGIIDYPANLHKVLKGEMRITDAVFIHPTKIHLVAGSLSIADARSTSVVSIRKHLIELSQHYDVVLVDTASGLEQRPMQIIESCNNIFVITTPELTAVTDTVRIIEMLRKKRKYIAGIIVNRYRGLSYEITPEEIKKLYEIPIISIIPEDEHVQISISNQNPVVLSNPDCSASKEFMRIAAEISGVNYRKRKGLF